MVSHARRAGDLDPFDQPGKLASEYVFVVAADHDLDTTVGPGRSHFEPTAEPHPEHAYSLGRAQRPDFEGRSFALDLVGDRAPTLGKVEVLGSVHRVARGVGGRDTVDSEGSSTGLGVGDKVPRWAFGDDAQRVDGSLGFGALAVDVAEPDLDTADNRILERVEEARRSGRGRACAAPLSRPAS
ncbi:hypothetical protein ADL17_12430 [Micromonospora maris]|uniref:Uncharacterized protein n=1 Tax=Micromonospora maris TaxID=1003110 RepID=A0A9X0HZH3_9ACTN|nr:hypothetical protein ADL17_12430 [Micromonospora maris]